MLRSWLEPFLPASRRLRRTLLAHQAGLLDGPFTPIPVAPPPVPDREQQHIHFWTPYPTRPSATVYVDRVLPRLREQAAALGLSWRITSGVEPPEGPVDWLMCLKKAPPAHPTPVERTVLMLGDEPHLVWGRLDRFGHVISVATPELASLLGAVHPRAWFMEETEAVASLDRGRQALARALPSRRGPVLLWHGIRDSLVGLYPLRPALEAFGAETGAELVVLTDVPETVERWGPLKVSFVRWTADAVAHHAARARLGIVPARQKAADSYLKPGGRMRCLFAHGCPAIGDSLSRDAAAFAATLDMPTAHTPDQWLAVLRRLWNDPDRLDALAQRGHALVRERFSTPRTVAQWMWFFGGGAELHGQGRTAGAPQASVRA